MTASPSQKTVASRLVEARTFLHMTQSAMAEATGIALRTWQAIEHGKNIPSGETLLKIASLGINPGWVLTGLGEMRIAISDGGLNSVAPTEAAASLPQIAASELLALVTDAIQRAYKEAGAGISGLDLGRLSAEKYNEIISEAPDPEDWRGAVRMMAAQLRRDISATAGDATNRKREAS